MTGPDVDPAGLSPWPTTAPRPRHDSTGGFFLAVNVPFRADNAALERSAEEFGVIWTPMSCFNPQGGGERSLRLSVSYLAHAQIADGIGRLARFIRAQADA